MALRIPTGVCYGSHAPQGNGAVPLDAPADTGDVVFILQKALRVDDDLAPARGHGASAEARVRLPEGVHYLERGEGEGPHGRGGEIDPYLAPLAACYADLRGARVLPEFGGCGSRHASKLVSRIPLAPERPRADRA